MQRGCVSARRHSTVRCNSPPTRIAPDATMDSSLLASITTSCGLCCPAIANVVQSDFEGTHWACDSARGHDEGQIVTARHQADLDVARVDADDQALPRQGRRCDSDAPSPSRSSGTSRRSAGRRTPRKGDRLLMPALPCKAARANPETRVRLPKRRCKQSTTVASPLRRWIGKATRLRRSPRRTSLRHQPDCTAA